MNIASPFRRSPHAFTLVELLTVIAIIAILMGLLFPAISIVKEQARKTQAKSDVMNIVTAVKQYQAEYGKYPQVEANPSNPNADALVGDTAAQATIDNNALFNTLRSINDGLNSNYAMNPRRIVFFEGKAVTDVNNPRSGFSDNATGAQKGVYYDPWGKEYNVIMDSNLDGVISLDGQYTDFSGNNAPRTGAGAFSLGKDGALGDKVNFLGTYRSGTTVSDDVISWQ